jgi:hypothetical protein
MRSKYVVVVGVFLSVGGGAVGQQPGSFADLKFNVDAEGFINLTVGPGIARFFPLGTFFYPALPPGAPVQGPTEDYQAFADMGGNLIVSPWAPPEWPARPGAIFSNANTCAAHLNAGHAAAVKILADPALFWGKTGYWYDDGNTVSDAQRETWFAEMVGWVEASAGTDVFMGYYQWDQPAWRYFNSPTPHPSPPYIEASTAHLRTLEDFLEAEHGVLIVQGDAVKVSDLWADYYGSADVAGCIVLPFPEPDLLQAQNETGGSPKENCLLRNYYSSVTGSLADAVHAAAVYNTGDELPPTRCKPYIGVLQGKSLEGEVPTLHQMRFQAYDAIIHGAKGLVWYDDNDFQPLNGGTFYEEVTEPLEYLLGELSSPEFMAFLAGDYEHTLILVDTYTGVPGDENYVERSSIIGGKMVPRTHFLSDQIMVESVAKKYNDYTYIIAARRPNVYPETDYTVRFRPCFSKYDQWNPWKGTNESGYIEKYNGNNTWVQIPVISYYKGSGYWAEDFSAGDVNIYRFIPPPPG